MSARFPWHRQPHTRVMVEVALDEKLLRTPMRRPILHEASGSILVVDGDRSSPALRRIRQSQRAGTTGDELMAALAHRPRESPTGSTNGATHDPPIREG
jgi:hypothetical protein